MDQPIPLKARDMIPALHRTFKIRIEKRKKPTAEELEQRKLARAAARAAKRESGDTTDPDDDEDDDDDEEDRSQDVSLSSEYVVPRWFGNEVLMHGKDNVDLSGVDPSSGIPLLSNHDSRSMPIGRLKDLRVDDKSKQLKARMVTSKTPRGQEAQTLIDEGHREMSLGYEIHEYEATPGKSGEPDEYRATKWTPLEGSLVSTPADPTIGVGRSAGAKLFPVNVTQRATPALITPEVIEMDPKEAAATATRDAAKTSAEIMRRATLHGVPQERALEWLEQGLTIDQVNERILESRASKPVKPPAAEQLQLSEREAKQYSYTRAILQAANMAEGKRVDKSFEQDIAQELERTLPQNYKQRGGLLIPTSLRNLKREDGSAAAPPISADQLRRITEMLTRAGGAGTIDSITTNYIKEVVFTEYGGELIEILRAMALVVSMGARVLTGLSSPVAFPRQTQDVTAYWVAENSGVNVPDSNVATDLVTLNPKTLQAATAYSRQLLVQSSVDVEAMVRSSIAAQHALALDKAALHGTGTNNQPLGIYNQPNVLTHDFSGVTGQLITWADLVAMEGEVAAVNALLGSLGWLTTPSIAGRGKTTLAFPTTAGSFPIWQGSIMEGLMDGYKARATNQVSKTLGANGAATGGTYNGLIFGNWSDILIGQFGGAMEMIVDPYTLKKQGLIEVTSFQMADVAVRHPQSFCVAINLNP